MTAVLVQKSAALATFVATGAGTVTPTLPGGSTSGNTLVAMWVSDSGSDGIDTPAGWSASIGTTSIVVIQWLPNCGSGVTSQVLSKTTAGNWVGNGVAALFEFSGVDATSADLNELGTPASGTSWSATTVANMTGNNELILLGWRETHASATKDSFTATTSGITQDFTWNQATKTVGHASFEHKLDSGSTTGSALTVTETMTDGAGNNRRVTIVSFKLLKPIPNGPVHLPFVT